MSTDGSSGNGRLLTVEQVAEMYQVPKSWVYGRVRKRGVERLPHLKLGKYLRFEDGAVRQFLERQKVSVKQT